MSLEKQLENQRSQIQYFQEKYVNEDGPKGQRSLTPKQKTKSYPQKKRVQSGQLFKVNSHNFIQKPKELLGGGFYKRSQINNSVPMFKQMKYQNQDEEYSVFPQIDNQPKYQNIVKGNSANNNLALIQEENDDIFNTGQNGSSRKKDQKEDLSLQKENYELKKIIEEQKLKESFLNSQLYDIQTRSMADQIQYYLQGAHHCHFEEQTFELVKRLRLNDEILVRIKAELEKVIGMVKNYNTEGLLARILDLEQLIRDLDTQRSTMIVEIEMLGLQRDEWHEKYHIDSYKRHQSIQNKLINMAGTDQKLLDAEKKVKMQGDTLEKLNRRLKERQIEIQDWQRKCSTNDVDKNKRILDLEAFQRDILSQLSIAQQDLKQSQIQLNLFQADNIYKTDMFDEEKRKTKQLHSEILDLRVNRITGLQEDVAKQKKVIQLRVEEIEELEVKVKQFSRKIEFLETQIKNFEEVAEQKLKLREIEWVKQFKEFEKQAIQTKQQINLLGIQIQEKDIFIQLKTQECVDAHARIQVLLKDIDQFKLIQSKLLNKITENEQTIEEKNQNISQLEQDIVNWQHNNEEQLQTIKEFEIKTADQEKIINQQNAQIESYKSHMEALNRHVESLKLQIESSNQQITKERQKYQEEVHKVELEREKNKILREELAEKEQIIGEQKIIIQNLEAKLVESQQSIKNLQQKIIEMQEKDEFMSAKLKKQLEQLETSLNEEKLITKNLQAALEQLQSEASKTLLIIQENENKINLLQADKLKLTNQIQQMTKKEKQLTDQNKILTDKNAVLATAEKDLKLYKEQVQGYETTMKEFEMVKLELQKTIIEKETLRLLLEQIQQKLQQEEQLHIQDNDQNKVTIENQLKQQAVLQKQLRKTELELVDAQNKIDLLMESMEGMNDDGIKQKGMPASNLNKKEVMGQPMEKVKQVFVDEMSFANQGEQIQVKFEDLHFDTTGGAHLTIAFWIRIGLTNSKEAFPVVRIICSRSKQTLLELGVHLDSGTVYATYYPKPKNTDESALNQTPIHRPSTSPSKVNDNMLTVTSQLSVRLNYFSHIALTLNEYGSNMDMGLCLNGVRDDQVSVSRTVLLPEAVLIFGCNPEQVSSTQAQLSPTSKFISLGKQLGKKIPKFIIKDALVFTKSIQSTNIFKHISNYFTNIYNQIPEKKIKIKGQKSQNQSQMQKQHYLSSGDLVFNLLQQELIAKPHSKQIQRREVSPKNSTVPSKLHYQVNQPVSFRGRMIPANLVDTCDLLREQSEALINKNDLERHTESKLVSEHHQTEVEKIWSRSKAVQSLKSAVDQDISLRGLLRPIMQHYFYICQTLQLMSPPFIEGTPVSPFQSYITQMIRLVKLPGPIFYLISLDSFYFLLEYCGLQKIDQQKLLEVCQIMEIIIDKTGQYYIHYDHLMIVLREVVMNKAQSTIMKYQEKKQIHERNHPQDNEEAESPTEPYTNQEDLDLLELIPTPDNWNLGKFTLTLNRCRGCEKHAHTTRHTESDFIDKSNQLQGSLKESFPNIQIQENLDKMDRLECFELYIKGVGNKAWMDKDGKLFLFIKNESVPKFQESFESRLPRIYEKLALIISVYETTHKMGDEQAKLLKTIKQKMVASL